MRHRRVGRPRRGWVDLSLEIHHAAITRAGGTTPSEQWLSDNDKMRGFADVCTTMRTPRQSESRASASGMLDLVERGEEVRILRHRKLVVDLVPLRPDLTMQLPVWERRDHGPMLLLPAGESHADARIHERRGAVQ
jgi:antitoxin (DNA-binding transcriptional repressor) of toxin-antitoxin stability system